MAANKIKLTKNILSGFIIFVFVQSLFFKFSDAPETQYIFGTLNTWANDTFGIDGLFVKHGIFNAYVIGTAELIASIFLALGILKKCSVSTFLGAGMAFVIISGAISFHLFTPLGINVQGDNGTLFAMACGVWISSVILVFITKKTVCTHLCKKNKETS